MIHEVLSPGMQDADKPYVCTEMLKIIGEFHKRLRDPAEQYVIHYPLVHDYQGGSLRWYGEDHVEVFNRQ
jgi:hypothetical protein